MNALHTIAGTHTTDLIEILNSSHDVCLVKSSFLYLFGYFLVHGFAVYLRINKKCNVLHKERERKLK